MQYNLQNQIEKKRKDIAPDKQYMTIGELSNLYKEGDLIINPDFQRFFRWSIEQKTKLIESVLLSIPLPPVFIYERKDGKWEVIDGLQRLSSLFEFIGIIKPAGCRSKKKDSFPLILTSAPYLTELNGKRWDDFTEAQQRYIKRAGFDIIKLKFDSAEFTKYELFQRLNRGGTPLTEQEIRNCMIIMENKQFLEWMEKLSQNKNFMETYGGTDKELDERKDLGLVTRYLCIKHSSLNELKKVENVENFLNSKIVALASDKSFNYTNEEAMFRNIFEKLNASLGPSAFRKYYTKDKMFKGGFYLSLYEVVIFALTRKRISLNKLKEKIIKMQTDARFLKNSGAGKRASQRWRTLLDLGLEIFNAQE